MTYLLPTREELLARDVAQRNAEVLSGLVKHQQDLLEDAVQVWAQRFDLDVENENGKWQPLSTSLTTSRNDELVYKSESDLQRIRTTGRRLCNSNPFAINCVENGKAYIVGTGHNYKVKRKEGVTPDQVSDDVLDECRDIISKFRVRNQWSIRQDETWMRGDRDGECLRRLYREGSDLLVRFVEPEQLKSPSLTQTDEATSRSILYGVRYRELGREKRRASNNRNTVRVYVDYERPVSYFIHPLIATPLVVAEPQTEGDEVPAFNPETMEGELQHIKFNVDLTAPRGISTFWCIEEFLDRAVKNLRAMSTVVGVQAAIAMIRKHATASQATIQAFVQNIADATVTAALTNKTVTYQHFKPGSILDVKEGTTYDFPSMGVDVGRIVAAVQAELRAAAARVQYPEFMFTSDPSGAPYSAVLVAEGPVVKKFERCQQRMIEWDTPLIRLQLQLKADAGELPRNILDLVDIDVDPPRVKTRNLGEEVTAGIALAGADIIAKAEVAGNLGYDYDKSQTMIDEQKEKEKERAEKFGPPPGTPGAPAPNDAGPSVPDPLGKDRIQMEDREPAQRGEGEPGETPAQPAETEVEESWNFGLPVDPIYELQESRGSSGKPGKNSGQIKAGDWVTLPDGRRIQVGKVGSPSASTSGKDDKKRDEAGRFSTVDKRGAGKAQSGEEDKPEFDADAWNKKPNKRDAWKNLPVQERDRQADAANSIPARARQHLDGLPDRPETDNLQADLQTRASHYQDRVAAPAMKQIADVTANYADLLGQAGVDPKVARKLAMDASDLLCAQEMESMTRQLGDHGISHIGGNIRTAAAIMDVVPHAATARDRAVMMTAQLFHDTGYLTPPSQNFLDEGHPRWSAEYFRERVSPLTDLAFGKRASAEIEHTIRTHDSSNVDWTNDPIGSAVRIADNSSLFYKEKLPGIFRYAPENLAVLTKLGHKEISLEDAHREMKANVLKADVPDRVKLLLGRGVEEVSEFTPKFTLGMLGGNLDRVVWVKAENGGWLQLRLRPDEQMTKLHQLGDFGQKQFAKFAESYGVSPDQFKKDLNFKLASPDGTVALEGVVVSGTKESQDPQPATGRVDQEHQSFFPEPRSDGGQKTTTADFQVDSVQEGRPNQKRHPKGSPEGGRFAQEISGGLGADMPKLADVEGAANIWKMAVESGLKKSDKLPPAAVLKDKVATNIAGALTVDDAKLDAFARSKWGAAALERTKKMLYGSMKNKPAGYKAVTAVLASWATSSHNDNPLSIAVQHIVSKRFKTPPPSDVRKTSREKEVQEILNAHGDVLNDIIGSMYAQTQAEFRKRGVTSVTLCRGMGFDSGSQESRSLKEASTRKTWKEGDLTWETHGGIANLRMQPASSFSLDLENTTHYLGDMGDVHVLALAKVPANRVLCTAEFGMGCLDDFEFIVIGGEPIPAVFVMEDTSVPHPERDILSPLYDPNYTADGLLSRSADALKQFTGE